MEGGGSARQHRLMQNETRQTTTAAAFGRSSIARLPPELREAVDAAIADGATIDEITARIRAEGGACSRSAVGRYVKNVRDLIRQQQEADRANEAWVRALGARAQGRAGLILIETLRTLTLSALADLSRREEPVSTAELARLALVLKRIEGTDKLRLERERAAAKAARAAPGAGQAPVRKGLSPEAVAAIREVVEGRPRRPARAVTSAPVDPWNPAESQLIPLNPGESRPENVSGVSRPGPTPFESLAGRTPAPLNPPPARPLPSFSNPSTAGAKLIISLNGGRVIPRAPLACLRAIRRGARSRAPDLRSGPLHGEHLLSRRARAERGRRRRRVTPSAVPSWQISQKITWHVPLHAAPSRRRGAMGYDGGAAAHRGAAAGGLAPRRAGR